MSDRWKHDNWHSSRYANQKEMNACPYCRAEILERQLAAQTAREDAAEGRYETGKQAYADLLINSVNEIRTQTARADALAIENLDLKRLMCEFQIHDSACDISDMNDPTYFGECDCQLSKWEEEIAAMEPPEDKP